MRDKRGKNVWYGEEGEGGGGGGGGGGKNYTANI